MRALVRLHRLHIPHGASGRRPAVLAAAKQVLPCSYLRVPSPLRQCDDKDFRGPSWRRQFPPRDVHGISMMPGSAETLPAGFRLTTTSGHSRRLPPEGESPCLGTLSVARAPW
ncbi:Liprin-alpha-2 [Liparis tanakae]|uniref:Liprin-alpha-2 n=1 Tax=Liparis tanakae TaxID=230148 RepID=A0A4Z2H677_9TELE|nr:Liprin-alpha-2 [Liparis tanakae]